MLGLLCSHIRKPSGRCLPRLQVFRVAVLLHVALVERSAWVEEHAHVVVCVVFEPDAHAGGSVESEVFPGPPQCFHAGERFGVEVPLDAPLGGAAVDVADVSGE